MITTTSNGDLPHPFPAVLLWAALHYDRFSEVRIKFRWPLWFGVTTLLNQRVLSFTLSLREPCLWLSHPDLYWDYCQAQKIDPNWDIPF